MTWFSKSSHWDTTHFVTLSTIQYKHNLILASNKWQICISWDRINLLSHWSTTSYEKKHNFNINLNSTFTNTAVATTVGFPDLNLTWQLRNDGEASALSGLLLHLSMTHGSDCHCYLARVHRHPVYNGTYGWGGRQLPTTTDPQLWSLHQCWH